MSLEEKNSIMSRKGFDELSYGTSLSSEPFSSSGLSTPYESELGSTETESSEGEEFMAELTRQMANYMLEDEDEDKDEENQPSKTVSKHTHQVCDSPSKWCGSNSTSTYYCDQRLMNTSPIVDTSEIYRNQTLTQSIEVYELKNQPPIRQENCLNNFGKRQEMIHESAVKQPMLIKQHQHNKLGRSGYGGNTLSTPNGSGSGSGMRAIFLNGGGGSGSRNGSTSTGTGVFLPRVAINNQLESKKRPGCSTVLVPARVLQALETHFNNMDALSQSNGCGGSTNRNRRDVAEQKKTIEAQTRPSNDQEMQLPEDWTY